MAEFVQDDILERLNAKIDLDLHFLEPVTLGIRKDRDALALILPDKCYFQVEARRAFPLSKQHQYVTFFDANDKEIGMLKDVRELPIETRKLLEEELDRRYFTPRIRRVLSMKEEFGMFRLDVETDKGRRDFHLRNLRDNVLHMPPNRIVLTDIHGNRFEIRDASRLDARSLANIAKII